MSQVRAVCEATEQELTDSNRTVGLINVVFALEDASHMLMYL